jgi:hypothetical protein
MPVGLRIEKAVSAFPLEHTDFPSEFVLLDNQSQSVWELGLESIAPICGRECEQGLLRWRGREGDR